MPTLLVFMEKAELRQIILETRKSISPAERQAKNELICSHLKASLLFSQAKTILAYFSFRSEPDITELFNDTNYQWGVPRCVGDSLFWHRYQYNDPVVKGKYGITEPHPDAPKIYPEEVDLILVPCVACDYQGYRLGYGGGYYDRIFSQPEWSNKFSIGIVYDFAFLPELPADAWDKPLNAVCTEKGIGNGEWGIGNRE